MHSARERPLLSISLSYPAIFALGFGCSLSYYGYLRFSSQTVAGSLQFERPQLVQTRPEQLPDPLRERARVASNTFFRAFDEALTAITLVRILSIDAFVCKHSAMLRR